MRENEEGSTPNMLKVKPISLFLLCYYQNGTARYRRIGVGLSSYPRPDECCHLKGILHTQETQ